MDTNKYGLVACLYEGVVVFLYDGVVECSYKYNKDYFDVAIRNSLGDCFDYFPLEHP